MGVLDEQVIVPAPETKVDWSPLQKPTRTTWKATIWARSLSLILPPAARTGSPAKLMPISGPTTVLVFVSVSSCRLKPATVPSPCWLNASRIVHPAGIVKSLGNVTTLPLYCCELTWNVFQRPTR